MSQLRIDQLNRSLLEPSKLDFNPVIFSSTKKMIKKVSYCGHAASVYSDDEAAFVIKNVGKLVKHVDSIPFAIRLTGSLDLPRDFCEDNGDLGVGEQLRDLLELDGAENVILVITREVSGCFPPESIQTVKFPVIKDAALSALVLLNTHLQIEADRQATEHAARNKFIQETENTFKTRKEENERRIDALHSQISEKETAVKKYSDMLSAAGAQKIAYEELLQRINEIEREKDSLESYIENFEDKLHNPDSQNIAVGHSVEGKELVLSLDEAKKRYFTIKEELILLRQERKGREPEYNKLQKDIKHFDHLEKSLGGLKVVLLEALKERESIVTDYKQFQAEFFFPSP